jgi:hypothetical protein
MMTKTLALGALLGALALPLAAGAQQNPTSGTGGAKEQNNPSTVGVDNRPDREEMKNRQPQFQANEPSRPAMPAAPPPGTTR